MGNQIEDLRDQVHRFVDAGLRNITVESSIVVVTKMVCRHCKLEVQVCYRCDGPFNPDHPIGCCHNIHNEVVHYCFECDKLPVGLIPRIK